MGSMIFYEMENPGHTIKILAKKMFLPKISILYLRFLMSQKILKPILPIARIKRFQNKHHFFLIILDRISPLFVFFFMGENFFLSLCHRYKYRQNKTPIFILDVFFWSNFLQRKLAFYSGDWYSII
jgi:hypothetical protein